MANRIHRTGIGKANKWNAMRNWRCMKMDLAYNHDYEKGNTICSSCADNLRETDFEKCYIHRSYKPVDRRQKRSVYEFCWELWESYSVISWCIKRTFLNFDFMSSTSIFGLVKMSFNCSTSISINMAMTGVLAMSIVNRKSTDEAAVNATSRRITW